MPIDKTPAASGHVVWLLKWQDAHAWLCGSAIVELDAFWLHEIPRDHLVSDFEFRTMRATNVNTLLVRINQRLTDIDHLLNHYSELLRLMRTVAWIKQAARGLR